MFRTLTETRRSLPRTAAALLLLPLLGAATLSGQEALPSHPEELTFQPLSFEPPQAEAYRHELSNGVPVFLAPSHEFPLVEIGLSFKGGEFLDPADQIGLADMTAAMMRRGGTETVSAEEMDERFDFLAANASVASGDTSVWVGLNSLKSNLDESFELFLDMVRNPGFDAERSAIYRAEQLEGMKQRNDDVGTITRREFAALWWGRDHFEGWVGTAAMLESITEDDLRAHHERVFHPGNLKVAVSGDFEVEAMLARLEKAFAGWEAGAAIPDPVGPNRRPEPGIYFVRKDVPQGQVRLGHVGIERDHPDAVAIEVMNEILGGAGFSSRVVNRIRSDEGLAYGAGTRFVEEVWYPGYFVGVYASKNPTVAFALRILLEEMRKIQEEEVTAAELRTIKNQQIEVFPRFFESKDRMLQLFIDDEWTDRPEGYWQTYRDKVQAVTAADVQRVAKQYLHPDQVTVLVVGNWEEIEPGNVSTAATEAKATSMGDFFGGEATELPLRDPLTQEPLAAN